MDINTNGTCRLCDGKVRNIPGRRHHKQRLTDIHLASCPGALRRKGGRS